MGGGVKRNGLLHTAYFPDPKCMNSSTADRLETQMLKKEALNETSTVS
jgi:hypothetical protein